MFIIEQCHNGSYINALIMALFYIPSRIEYLLNSDPKQSIHYYLQQLIKIKYIDVARKNQSVITESVNEIRNYSHLCGWQELDKLLDMHDIITYFTFLMNCFNGTTIQTLNNQDKSFTIKINIPKADKELTIKEIVNKWNNENILLNAPTLLSIHINRFDLDNKVNTKINIQKKIKITDSILNMSNEWVFHAIICHSGDSLKTGHYYSIITNGNKWFMFNDESWPCIKEIRMDNLDIVNKIKQECVLIIYRHQEHY